LARVLESEQEWARVSGALVLESERASEVSVPELVSELVPESGVLAQVWVWELERALGLRVRELVPASVAWAQELVWAWALEPGSALVWEQGSAPELETE
jgi:hypothetical protein